MAFNATEIDPQDAGFSAAADGVAVPGEPRFSLTRCSASSWRFDDQFAYTDLEGRTFVVPADPESFRSDMMSIPPVFAWLVPANGRHTPGVLLHDGLVRNPLTEPDPTHIGPAVTRVEADRLLREANQRCGTPFLRRWLIWTAVMTATLKAEVWSTFRWWLTIALLVGITSGVGIVATLDLFDTRTLTLPLVGWQWSPQVPWMGNRPWYAELLTGGVVAVGFPAIISLTFGRHWRVGLIAGLWIAVLLHATLAVGATAAAIAIAERSAHRLGLR